MRHLSMQRVSVQPLQWRRAPAPTVVSRNRRMTCAMAGSPAVYTPTTGSFERMIGGHAQEQAALQRTVRQPTRTKEVLMHVALMPAEGALMMHDDDACWVACREERRTTTYAW
jgi:hypothetical protein